MFSERFTLMENQRILAYLSEKRRLSGIRIVSETNQTNVLKFQKAKFSFVGDEEYDRKIGYERINDKNSISFFIFTNLTEELTSVSVELIHSRGFYVGQLEIYAFPNQCGHPEIPINGTVNWQSGSPIATYSCHSGYAVHSADTTRTCDKGKWSGNEPVCKPISLNRNKIDLINSPVFMTYTGQFDHKY
jgi:Sushi repeat (SCR repeat)